MTSTSGAAHSGGGLMGGVASTAGRNGWHRHEYGWLSARECWRKSRCGNTFHWGRGGLTSMGRLSSNSSGVFGLEGLSINSEASSATQGSAIVFLHEKRSPGKRHTDASVRCGQAH